MNIAGVDFGLNVESAQLDPWATPTYPSTTERIALNATIFRFPILWNYLQLSFRESIPTSDVTFSHLNRLINYVTDRRHNESAYAILDVVSPESIFRSQTGFSSQCSARFYLRGYVTWSNRS